MQQHFFCPNPDCPWHTPGKSKNDWYTPNGFYPTKVSGSVARFKCKSCNTGFSTQTFDLDYYVKKKVSYKRIENLCRSSVCDRAIVTQLEISPVTVINRIERLARQFIAFHTDNLADLKLI